MAAVAPPSDRILSNPLQLEAAEFLQKLSIDSQTKTIEVPEPTKKYVSMDSAKLANGIAKPYERSTSPFPQEFVDPNMGYFSNGYPPPAYYYGGFEGQGNEYPRYLNPDAVEMTPGVYGENGAVMYPNVYGFASYPPPGSPVTSVGHDGQLYGPQQYQYPTYYSLPTSTGSPLVPSQANATQGEVFTSVAADQVPLSGEIARGNSAGGSLNGNNGPKALRPSYRNSSYGRGSLQTGIPHSGYQDLRVAGMRSPFQWLDAPTFSDGQSKHATSAMHANNLPSGRNQNLHPLPHLMTLHHGRPASGMSQASGYINRMYPGNRMYDQFANSFRTGSGFGSMAYDSRTSGRGWLAVDSKYKTKGRGNGFFGYNNENMDSLNELNRGPRAKGFKNQKGFGSVPLKENNIQENLIQFLDKELYNKEDFPEKYSDAKFFIIKSYSEDDVHKSIKYGMWASTPNGNKKLDAAYQEAQEKPGSCPIFLLFSVNASGQFVGLAEMVGPVDFNKNMEYWQQDKWTGCFSVKWHIIKDIPNSLLKHITLENNDNKPLTNSRDTQEVKFEQGIQVLKIFKGHSSKTCILDDFGFYEARQRTMQERKAKQQQFQKQVWDGKPSIAIANDEKDKDGPRETQKAQKSLDVAAALIKEAVIGTAAVNESGEVKLLEGNSSAAAVDRPGIAESVLVSENRVV